MTQGNFEIGWARVHPVSDSWELRCNPFSSSSGTAATLQIVNQSYEPGNPEIPRNQQKGSTYFNHYFIYFRTEGKTSNTGWFFKWPPLKSMMIIGGVQHSVTPQILGWLVSVSNVSPEKNLRDFSGAEKGSNLAFNGLRRQKVETC